MDYDKLKKRMDEREALINEIRAKGKKSTIKLTELFYQQKLDMFKMLREENRRNGKRA